MSAGTGPPAPRPCASCPYRADVPAGIWAASEYHRLRAYDQPTAQQPTRVFLCHQHDRASTFTRLCAGWVGCHDPHESLALRIALTTGDIDAATYDRTVAYVSPVPLFDSGAAAAAHGTSGIEHPTAAAHMAIAAITRRRRDLT